MERSRSCCLATTYTSPPPAQNKCPYDLRRHDPAGIHCSTSRTEIPGRRFRYTWTRTWPDRHHDFSAKEGEMAIGRVYRLAGVCERWKWAMTASIGNRI